MLFKISFGLLTLSMILAVACADDPSADDNDAPYDDDVEPLALRAAGDAGTPAPGPTWPWPFPSPTPATDAAAPSWPSWPFPAPTTPGDGGTRDGGRPPVNPFDPSTW